MFPCDWSPIEMMMWLRVFTGGGGGEETIVSGVSPLSLTNALAKSIVSLTQYGLCTQASTPTPSSPVDIKCNNGVLYNKNLFKTSKSSLSKNGVKFVPQTDGSIVVSGTAIGYASYDAGKANVSTDMENVVIKLRGMFGDTNISVDSIGLYDANSTRLETVSYNAWTTSATLNLTNYPTASFIAISIKRNSNTVTEGVVKIQVEMGTTPTEWQPYGKIIAKGTPEVLTVSGANMLNPTTVPSENQFINKTNGNLTSPSASGGVWRHSDYIPVVGGETYYFHQVNAKATTAGTAWYDDKLTYIDGISATELGTANNKITLPSNVAYIRHSWRTDDGYNTDWENTVYICVDGSMTEFQPYVTPQTASVENLFAVGDTKDEQDIISGVVIRRCAACLYDGTQPVGDNYLSTTGGKDVGAIIVYPLATPTTETVAAQTLTTAQGTNTITATAEVSPIQLSVAYMAKSE